MFPLDIAIWERFLVQYGADYVGFDYDVKVGAGTPPRRTTSNQYRIMQAILSKFRIDAVGYRKNMLEIIEVKPRASASAIGQALTYAALYARERSTNLPVRAAIVTSRRQPDMDYLTNQFNINYYVV